MSSFGIKNKQDEKTWGQGACSLTYILMSTDELKIIRELEKDVERDLEEEIKDGIYRLAFKLHRLYQHQIERYENESPYKKEQHTKTNKILSELNINIRMKSGTTIEIKETKNGTPQISPKLSMSSASVYTKRIPPPRKQKFNWENTLRSSDQPLCTKNENITTPKSDKKCPERATRSTKVMAHRNEQHINQKILTKRGTRD
uniref:uncharacterized protein LOC122587848 n=1 Tax=Erigeron canadensis TaxID=72917 RepID=UPI001CB910BE|nr:uncharacterized protein LOC122587848 [Erigeron canadensis]